MMLEFKGLNLAFKDKVLLEESYLKLFPGKITCLSGKSGSGKTTLLNYLFRRLRKKQVLYINQTNNFFLDMTCKDNLYYLSKIYGVKVNDDLILKAMEEVGLKVALNVYPNTLSGGEKQRLLLVMALLIKAEIIFMDEITASMDEVGRKQFIQLLKDFTNKQQCIVLISTHDDYLIENSDVHYRIENKKLVCLKGLDEKIRTKLHNRNNCKSYCFSYFKYTLKKHLPLKLLTTLISGLILSCLVVGAVFFIQIDQETKKIVNTNPANQMLVHYENMYSDHSLNLTDEEIESLNHLDHTIVYPFVRFEQASEPSTKDKRAQMYEMKWVIDDQEYIYLQDSSENMSYSLPSFYPYYENQHLDNFTIKQFEKQNLQDTIPCYILEDYLPYLDLPLKQAKRIIIETKIKVPCDAKVESGLQIRKDIEQVVDMLNIEYQILPVKLEVLGIVHHHSGNYGGHSEFYVPYSFMKSMMEQYPQSSFLRNGDLYYASGYMLFSDDLKQVRSMLNQQVPNVRISHSRDSLSNRFDEIQENYVSTISKLLMISVVATFIAFSLFSILNERSFKANRNLLKIRGLKNKQIIKITLFNSMMDSILVFTMSTLAYLYVYQVLKEANYMVALNDYGFISMVLLVLGSIIFSMMSQVYSFFKCIK